MTELQPRSLPSLDATVFLRLLLEDEDVLKEPTTLRWFLSDGNIWIYLESRQMLWNLWLALGDGTLACRLRGSLSRCWSGEVSGSGKSQHLGNWTATSLWQGLCPRWEDTQSMWKHMKASAMFFSHSLDKVRVVGYPIGPCPNPCFKPCSVPQCSSFFLLSSICHCFFAQKNAPRKVQRVFLASSRRRSM